MGQLLEKGCSFIMKERMLYLKDRNDRLLAHIERAKNRMFKLNLKNIQEKCLQVNMEDKALLWDLQFRHLHYTEKVCEGCVLGK